MDVTKQEEVSKGLYQRRVRIDRISELPDELLLHILSFLPIEYAITTSILSTRWRYLWTSLPILNFKYLRSSDQTNPIRLMKFIIFVDRFLLGHDMNIQKFSLNIEDEVDESHVNAWTSIVVTSKVQELCLAIDVEDPFALPSNLFTCESLVKLTIDGNFILKVPTSTCFSSLKILNLLSLKFSDDYSTQQLFSNCPVLEELTLDHCSWGDIKIFNISGLALKRLAIQGSEYGEGVDLDNCVIKIYAPNLIYLSYFCGSPKDFDLGDFPSLIHASICFENEYWERSDEELGYVASKFIKSLSNVKVLDLSGETFEILSNANDRLTCLPPFQNLIRLKVSSTLPFPIGRSLLDLLQISPNLEYLVFTKELTIDEECWMNGNVPQCLSLHLKEVKFKQFGGNETEFYVLEYLLKNSRVLEKMTICGNYSPEDPKNKLEIAKQILMLPRGSSNSVIEFI